MAENIDPTLMALAVSVGFFVKSAVDVVKDVLGASRRRRWLLPLCGVLLGWLFVGLVVAYQSAPEPWRTVALVLLGGFLAFFLARMASAGHAASRGPDDGLPRASQALPSRAERERAVLVAPAEPEEAPPAGPRRPRPRLTEDGP